MLSSLEYIQPYLSSKHYSVFQEECDLGYHRINSNKTNQQYEDAIQAVAHIHSLYKDYEKDVVTIGRREELSSSEHTMVYKALRTFMPYRKGPFSIFGIDIDSEWRSNLKWNRIKEALGPIKNKIICDVGCGNGYYLFRLLHYQPKLVLGIDPTAKFKLNFTLLNTFAQEKAVKFEPIGYASLKHFHHCFDTILCMGILYHHKNPWEVLQLCQQALKPGGLLVVESIGIQHYGMMALCPHTTYASMKNIYWIPSKACLESWLIRSKWDDIICVNQTEMTPHEQRRTPWADVPSYADFLDEHNPKLTKEKYPAPCRIIFTARKK